LIILAVIGVALICALFFRNLREQQNRIERHQRELIELARTQAALLAELAAKPKH
jgi:hypothetical protein